VAKCDPKRITQGR